MADERAHELLNRLLLDVPLTRGAGEPRAHLAALVDAALFTPVFLDWPSPVPGWLDEAEALARQLGDGEAAALVAIRRAAVRMRLGDFDAALAALATLPQGPAAGEATPRLHCYAAVTRSRIHTRRADFPAAEAALAEAAAVPLPRGDWAAALPAVARGELHLQRNDLEPARTALTAARRELAPELVEERVQVLQSLGFIRIAQRDAAAAERLLDEARGLLEAAGAWPEVVQMAVVVANLRIARGRAAEAEPLLTQALGIAREHGLTLWEPLLEMGLARAGLGREAYAEAQDAALRAAGAFARRGDAVGFFAMVSYLAALHQEAGEPAEAYRVLALGVAIAKRLRVVAGESALRAQIEALRERLGGERFDAMVQDLLDRRGAPPAPEAEDPRPS
jgi:tetratricopeptide (TPR) repeat protein